jgi:nitrous oxidase accessory protein NosD
MKAINFTLGSFLLLAFLASSGNAQQRTFVSGLGSDSNPCNRTSPCRTFGQAISQTNAGGEVIVLDSAGYGPVTINKAISLIAPPGVYAGITAPSSADGIFISAGPADTVILRGLTVNNQGSLFSGIRQEAGGSLHVENCVVNGFNLGGDSSGITFAGPGKLEVKDSTIRGNRFGIATVGLSGGAFAVIEQVRLEENDLGINIGFASKVTVRGCVASGGNTGFYVRSDNSSEAEVNVESCVLANNTFGIQAISTSTGIAAVRLSNSVVTDNATGLSTSGAPAIIRSRENNTVEGNGFDISGLVVAYTAK